MTAEINPPSWAKLKNLGVANKWPSFPPRIVVQCGQLGHFSDGTRTITSEGTARRLTCEKCGYSYTFETEVK